MKFDRQFAQQVWPPIVLALGAGAVAVWLFLPERFDEYPKLVEVVMTILAPFVGVGFLGGVTKGLQQKLEARNGKDRS